MPVIAIIGGQWGDEGKGKIVDMLAERAQLVARFSGGDNAGHTVINPYGEFRLHLVPSGIFYQNVICIIGNGVVINPEVLLKEIDVVRTAGLKVKRLYISERAHLIMPYHLLFDALEERRRGNEAIGTTGRGIGPAFTDKVARQGLRVGDLLNEQLFLRRLQTIMEDKNAILTKIFGAQPMSVETIHGQFMQYRKQLAPFIRETEAIVHEQLAEGSLLLLEGAQGSLLDLDFGTYPYVTSSSPLAGNGCLGTGIGPRQIDAVLGIFKAYTTRVGSGPMPSEMEGQIGELIRKRANEYGATTGRPRRCGWFDAVVGHFTTRINGFTSVALTRLDILDTLPSIKVCTAYTCDGKLLHTLPSRPDVLEKCQPVFEELEGWQSSTQEIQSFARLPAQARRYIRRIEELISCPIDIVSVGPRREQTIEIRPLLGKHPRRRAR